MRVFTPLYELTMNWAAHQRAPYYLWGVSFAESSVFPVPVEVMLVPMVLAKPAKWQRFALFASVASVLGGVAGYLIGAWVFDWVAPWLLAGSGRAHFDEAQQMFETWGVWIIFLAAFTPIPYKIFTISAGFMGLFLVPFLLASILGRAARFYLVAGLVRWGGLRVEPWLHRYVEPIGWGLVALLVLAVGVNGWR